MKKNKKMNIVLKGNGVSLEYTPAGYKCYPEWFRVSATQPASIEMAEKIKSLIFQYWNIREQLEDEIDEYYPSPCCDAAELYWEQYAPDWHAYEEEIFNLLGLYWDEWQTCEGVTIEGRA